MKLSTNLLLGAAELRLLLGLGLARRRTALPGKLPPVPLGRVVLGVAPGLLEGALQVRDGRE